MIQITAFLLNSCSFCSFYAQKLNNVIVSILTSKYKVDLSVFFNSLGIILPGHTQYCTREDACGLLQAVQHDQKKNCFL
jgi:hypothetical protein